MTTNWWQARKEELLTLTEKECPLYVYNDETLNDLFFDLLSLYSLQGLFYPIAASPHPKIMTKAFDMGLGFLCASTEELKGLLDQFPKIDLRRLMFLDDDPSLSESGQASEYGTPLIVKDPLQLKVGQAAFQGREIYLFLDSEIRLEAEPWLLKNIKGFYITQNSICSYSDDVNKNIILLTEAAKRFPEASILILGNSPATGVNDKKWHMDIQGLENYLEVINDACPKFNLWLEVPVTMVSSMGALLVKVTETGEKERKRYIRINMDMKSLIKNRLFENGHQIINLSRLDEEKSIMTRIIGLSQKPGDSLDNIKAPSFVQEGDILLFTDMGLCASSGKFNSKRRDQDSKS